MVRVIDMSDQSGRSGVAVRVDGNDVGQTDAAGFYWLEGDGPPKFVEVGVGDDSVEVVMSAYERADMPPGDPMIGYTFLVRTP